MAFISCGIGHLQTAHHLWYGQLLDNSLFAINQCHSVVRTSFRGGINKLLVERYSKPTVTTFVAFDKKLGVYYDE